jgi:hypothetical protein
VNGGLIVPCKGFGNTSLLYCVLMHATAPSNPLIELRAFADGVTQTLGVARGLVEGGRSVDLAGLEDQVGLVCAKALDLPPAEGRTMRGELVALLARVDALSVALLHARQLPG